LTALAAGSSSQWVAGTGAAVAVDDEIDGQRHCVFEAFGLRFKFAGLAARVDEDNVAMVWPLDEMPASLPRGDVLTEWGTL